MLELVEEGVRGARCTVRSVSDIIAAARILSRTQPDTLVVAIPKGIPTPNELALLLKVVRRYLGKGKELELLLHYSHDNNCPCDEAVLNLSNAQ